ncbi:MAG: CehA/McbA family metallohydrolase, partial [Candidatus Sericytochromatia bacterium]|nr:CehA/McbA family metallohydrolase [Candidatus Tanganyikabacteria bacterium]
MPIVTLPLLAGWILLANHTHTQASPDSTLRVADLDALAKDKGVQAVVITDHDNVRAVLDPAFHASSSVRFIEGEEWGNILDRNFVGHVGLIGLKGDFDVESSLPVEEALSQAKSRGALAVINHPFNWLLARRGKDIPRDAGGVEVWNQAWNDLTMRNDQALKWWDAGLRGGRRLVAVGGADVHGIRIW